MNTCTSTFLVLTLAGIAGLWPFAARAVTATDFERAAADRWTAAKFKGVTDTTKPGPGLYALANHGPDRRLSTDPPLSFTYDGRPSRELPKNWKVTRASRELDPHRVEHTLTYRDETSGLQLRCAAVEYRDFPTVEWTVYFRNLGPADTPVLSAIQALDLCLDAPGEGEFVLHHQKGDDCTPDSHEPSRLTLALAPRSEHRFAPAGGRPTNGAFPYFNLEWVGGGLGNGSRSSAATRRVGSESARARG